jgi:adenosylhomocysteinase
MDELDISISHRESHISEWQLPDGKILYLMNRGQAVNFVHGAAVGPFIQLLQAEILLAACAMLSLPRPCGIGSISSKQKKQIANEWLQVYRH